MRLTASALPFVYCQHQVRKVMSNKKRRNPKAASYSIGAGVLNSSVNQANFIEESAGNKSSPDKAKDSISQSAQADSSSGTGLIAYLKSHLLMVFIISFVMLGVLGAGLKYLDDDAKRELAKRANNKSRLNNTEETFLNKINPFLPSPPPSPTPQLSKEYLYAGSRLLAVEDANATVAPPADLAIWRPSNGEWWVMGSAGGSQQVTFQWGINSDKPVQGDYDGDGKTDFSVWRPSNGTWYIVNSSGGGGEFAFGQPGDLPAQADYDGDGKTDVAVYRPSTGVWYIQQSSNYQAVQAQFGLSQDIPAPADYDGDGRADIAVWRSSETKFYSVNSSNGAYQTPFIGQSGELVSGDYDGDGRANFAVKNGANWVIMNANLTQTQTTAWQSGDKPVQNDYDGDGKVDIAVWNAGTWYIKNSADNSTRTVQWGMAGDIPVPAYYRR